MKTSQDRILTTHMGSLPRVGGLAGLLVAKEAGEPVDAAALAAASAEAVATVVERQAECGIDIGNNGEMPRTSFVDYITDRISGFSRGGQVSRRLPLDAQHFPGWFESFSQSGRRRINPYDFQQATSDLEHADFAPLEAECDDLEQCLERSGQPFVEPFLSAVSPGFAATALPNDWYDSHEAYVRALAAALRPEYLRIVERGFLLQIDSPDLGLERAGFFQDESLDSFKASVEMHVATLNEALEGIPPDRVRLHACYGNRDSPHVHDVPCPDILPIAYQANVGAVCLPFANPRHQHEIESFRRQPLPEHMVLVVGVIETTNNYVEHPELVAERLVRAAECVGDPHRIIAGTDCGFGTMAGDLLTAEDVVWAKLEALAEGARIASGRLM